MLVTPESIQNFSCCCTQFFGDGHSSKVEESDGHDRHGEGSNEQMIVPDLGEPVQRILQVSMRSMTPILSNLNVGEPDEKTDDRGETKNACKHSRVMSKLLLNLIRIQQLLEKFQIQCPPLNRITLGQNKTDNNNRMIQLTDVFCVLSRYKWASSF